MARVLFFPVILALIALIIFLLLRVRSMFALSKSKDIELVGATPSDQSPESLLAGISSSLAARPVVEFESRILTNYRKINSYARTGEGSDYCKLARGSTVVEISGNDEITIRRGRNTTAAIARDNSWQDYWFGLSHPGRSIPMFIESGMKVMAGNQGTYMQRIYTELLVVSHALPREANDAFIFCAGYLDGLYNCKTTGEDIKLRNFMVRILINNLTLLPDFIETKFNIFHNGSFSCDYFQNSILLY